jgi:hypothetical protein
LVSSVETSKLSEGYSEQGGSEGGDLGISWFTKVFLKRWEKEKQRDRETERQRDRETERQRDRETERQRDRETERQRDRETERQKDRKTERKTVGLKKKTIRSFNHLQDGMRNFRESKTANNYKLGEVYLTSL